MSTALTINDLPAELIVMSCQNLDLCSLMNFMDTCRRFRHFLLTSTLSWRRIVIDFRYGNISEIYAALRRLKDSNGLRFLVQEVNMDNTDDPNLSLIVMLAKFPQLRYLSAQNRCKNTNLEADAKFLQEHLNRGIFMPHTLALERLNIYHRFMSNEPYLEAFQKVLNRLSRKPVQLDTWRCPGSCNRVISYSKCWFCNQAFELCWTCSSSCNGCQRRRLPPLANDQMALSHQKSQQKPQNDVEHYFSVFS